MSSGIMKNRISCINFIIKDSCFMFPFENSG